MTEIYQSSPKFPAAMNITSTSTLHDVINATILDIQPLDDMAMTALTANPDAYLDTLLNSLLNDPPTQQAVTREQAPTEPPTCSSPCPDSRLSESLTNLLGSPTPTTQHVSATELQKLIRSDVKTKSTPSTQLQTQYSTTTNLHSVNNRESQLQKRFHLLQNSFPVQIQQLSSFYQCSLAALEYSNRVSTSYQVIPPVQQQQPVCRSRPVLSKKSVNVMETWYYDNLHHPYPNNTIIQYMAQQTNLKEEQIKKWFGNKRNRCKNARPYKKKQKKLTPSLVQNML
ncbi:PBX2 [Mytilus edulis]|uniref:PBX2 n=1 Tax=Mytilus edulis TaxID=6550 RepID=A0A8S3UMG9_MYTED|nr:PBX2 [Mytilus edulis]